MKNEKKSSIGLAPSASKELAVKLNELLANYQLFYQNLRGFHWNISGPSFFELHAKFEEMYTAANEAVDEIAERVLTLEERPMHTFSSYLKVATIKEVQDVSDANESVRITIDNLGVLLQLERDLLTLSEEADDEGTNSLMSDYIREQEKQVWMLRAYNS